MDRHKRRKIPKLGGEETIQELFNILLASLAVAIGLVLVARLVLVVVLVSVLLLRLGGTLWSLILLLLVLVDSLLFWWCKGDDHLHSVGYTKSIGGHGIHGCTHGLSGWSGATTLVVLVVAGLDHYFGLAARRTDLRRILFEFSLLLLPFLIRIDLHWCRLHDKTTSCVDPGLTMGLCLFADIVLPTTSSNSGFRRMTTTAILDAII